MKINILLIHFKLAATPLKAFWSFEEMGGGGRGMVVKSTLSFQGWFSWVDGYTFPHNITTTRPLRSFTLKKNNIVWQLARSFGKQSYRQTNILSLLYTPYMIVGDLLIKILQMLRQSIVLLQVKGSFAHLNRMLF